MPASPRQRYIMAACIGYAVLSALWVVFSDLMLVGLDESLDLVHISLAKGLFFVAITSGLLALILRRVPLETQPLTAPAPARSRTLMVLFALVAVVIGAIAWISFRAQSDRLHDDVRAGLQAIARLKVAGISRWVEEYETDVRAASSHPGLRAALADWRLHGRAEARERVSAILDTLHGAYCPIAAELRSPDGERLLGSGPDVSSSGDVATAAVAAAASGRVEFIDLRSDAQHVVHITWLGAITAPEAEGGRVLGVLVCDVSPDRYLYPFIRTWPQPSSTGETLLIRREGDDVIYLNDLLHYTGAALFLRMPLSTPELPAARVARGDPVRDGQDYRGQPVLATGMAVPGTPWMIVAKIDRSEAEAAIRRLTLTTWFLTGAALAVAASLMMALWQRQRRRTVELALIHSQALDVAESRFRATFEQAAVGMAIVGEDGHWRLVNRRLCRILGRTAEDLQAALFAESLPVAADEGAVPAWFDSTPGEHEIHHRRPDGTAIWLNLTAARAHRMDGPADYFILVVEDVTARRTAEERVVRLNRVYRTLSETNQTIVRVTDRIDLFRAICRVGVEFGEFLLVVVARLEEDGLGWSVVDQEGPAGPLLDEPDRIGFWGMGGGAAAIRTVLVRDQQHQLVSGPDLPDPCRRFAIGSFGVFPLIERGVTTHALMLFAPESDYFDEDMLRLIDEMALDVSFGLDNLTQAEELRHAHLVLEQHRDELERRVTERTAELSAAKERAEAADRVKSAFLATMSHELRTPLNSVIGFTGVLLSERPGPLTAEQVKQLGIVRNAGHRLLALIGDILDISKIEAGEMVIDCVPIDLAALIERMVPAIQHQAQARGLTVSITIEPLPGPVLGDVRRIEQILDNLVSNAIKFTRSGGIGISCRVEEGMAAIAVSDTGIGIRPEDAARLFQPFVQIETGTVRGVKEGTGLGLSICRHLVEAMSGRIGLQSEFGRGSVFRVTLPIGGQGA